MNRHITVKVPDGHGSIKEENGTLMDIKTINEPWSEYTLEDDTVIRIKQTIIQIVKLDKLRDDGETQYSIQAQPIMNVIPGNKK